MAYKINAGTDKEVVFSLIVPLSYAKDTERVGQYGYDMIALAEDLQPFDLYPFLTAFLNDPTKDTVEFMHMPTTPFTKVQIKFSGDANNVTINFGSQSQYWSTARTLWNGDPRNAPNPLNLYWVYGRRHYNTANFHFTCMSDADPLVNYADNFSIQPFDPMFQVDDYALVGTSHPQNTAKITDLYGMSSLKNIPVSDLGMYYWKSDSIYNHPDKMLNYHAMDDGAITLWGSAANPFDQYVDNENDTPGHTDPPAPPSPFDPSGPTPYNPSLDDTSDQIDIPDDPDVGVTDAGFINVYNPSVGGLTNLGSILFPPIPTPTDAVEAITNLCDIMTSQNLINYIIDCHVIPVVPTTSAAQHIRVGFKDTLIAAPVVTSDYVHYTCGTLALPEYFGGFQDFLGTKARLYLPFLGFVDIKPEYWQKGILQVDYKFNVIDGSFMAYVLSTSSKSQLSATVIGQYAGNACMHFPITGINYASMVSGIIGAGFNAFTATGATGVARSVASALNTLAAGGNMQQSNGYNSTASILGVRTPYLLIERVVPSYPTKYGHDKGYPTNISTLLSGVTGFTVIEDIDLSGIPLTDGELEELRNLLKEGVYF